MQSMKTTGFAPGKIILSGEYAVVFGYPGIAVPYKEGIEVTFEEGKEQTLEWMEEEKPGWREYVQEILTLCNAPSGSLVINAQIPIGKGMGSSTALVIAITRAVLGEGCREEALKIEDAVNPGNSGLDFSVIWENQPVRFVKNESMELIDHPSDLLQGIELIDTGMPNEETPELVSWMKEKQDEVQAHLDVIAQCTDRIIAGEDLQTIIRDHHRAQCALGVIPERIQEMIQQIEDSGSAAKVIGAGSRTGDGAGMVLKI